MSTTNISILTEYIEKKKSTSTSRERVERLKKAGLLQENGELNPEFYTKVILQMYKDSNFNIIEKKRNYRLVSQYSKKTLGKDYKLLLQNTLSKNDLIKNED